MPDPIDADTGGGAEAVPAVPDAVPDILDTEIPRGVETFDRDYVDKVRAEAARWRTTARELEGKVSERAGDFEVLDKYSPEDQQVWKDMMSGWLDDPASTAELMQRIATGVLGDPNASDEDKQTAAELIDNADAGATDDLTPAKVQEMLDNELARRDEQARSEASVEAVFKQLADAGIERGTDDAFFALYFTNNHANGDVDKGVELLKARDQKVIDDYVAAKAKGGPRTIPSDGVAAAPAPQEITNLGDARRAATAYLEGRQTQPG